MMNSCLVFDSAVLIALELLFPGRVTDSGQIPRGSAGNPYRKPI
jgi:hypothetical protein